MKSFISSLKSGPSVPNISTTAPTNMVLSESEIVEIPQFGALQSNEARVLYLMGHSQISGKGNNADALPEERAFNDSVIWNGSSFVDFSIPPTGEHGRELGINAYYKDYFDATHSQKLHLVKHVIRGGCPYTIFILGTKYFNAFWNNVFAPSINQLLSNGKIPTIHFIQDIVLGFELYGTSEEVRYDMQASLFSFLYMLKLNNINVSFTGDVEPFGCQGYPNNVLGNEFTRNFVDTNPTYLKYTDKELQPTNDGCHIGYAGLKYCAYQHLQQIQGQPLVKVFNPLPSISDATLITYKSNPKQKDILSIKMDVEFDVIVQSNGIRFMQNDTTEFGVDIRTLRAGFVSVIGILAGITRFEAPYAGIYSEFDLIEKYAATLNYIDIRGNSLQPIVNMLDYSNNQQLQFLVNGNVSNGTLLMAESQVPLTSAAQANYDTLISRGWTIDVPRP